MKTVAKILFPIALLAILSGCKTADLSYAQGVLSLQVDNNHLNVNGTTLSSRNDSFGNLYLRQNMIKLKDGSIVVYERLMTDNLYEFNLIPLQTIHSVFDARRVISIWNKSSFYLFQLVLRDGRILNVAAEEFDDQRLTLVYGFSNTQLRNIQNNKMKQNLQLKDRWDLSDDHLKYLYNSIYHADVSINIASTLSLDSLVIGTPTINISFDVNLENDDDTVLRFYKSNYIGAIAKYGGVWLAKSKEEYFESLKK